MRHVWVVALVLILAECEVARAETPSFDLRFTAGASWIFPAGSPAGDLYDGGPGLAVGLLLEGPGQLAGALRADLYRGTASPSRPPFVESVESRLYATPVMLELEYRLRERGERSAFVVLGGGLWVTNESFDYRILGENRSASGSRGTFGGHLGVGFHLPDSRPELRFGLRVSAASLERQILRSSGVDLATDGSQGVQLWILSVEAAL